MMEAATVRIALVGVGKIARDQHVPALAGDPRFTLVATVDPRASLPGVPAFASLDALLRDAPPLEAVSICTPPQGRSALVALALEAGLHVMVEKPPATTLSEVAAMRAVATRSGRTLFAAWHSQQAGAVAPAKAWLAMRRITGFSIRWREDIRRWHPGQDWILDAEGFGVFDPGINALSIATAILPHRLNIVEAQLQIPANRGAPVSGSVILTCADFMGRMALSFLETSNPEWTIEVDTDAGTLQIREGGKMLVCDGAITEFPDQEYSKLYGRFIDLIHLSDSEIDENPLRLVEDVIALAKRQETADFHW